MLSKIISGGQTGADRGALDTAIELGVPHGGWVPKGRRAEDGAVPEGYAVQEMPSEGYAERTEQNVADSDGTLILSRGCLTGGSKLTMELALRHGRPVLHVDLNERNAFKAAQAVQTFVRRHGIRVLNVAGPRASKDPDIYNLTRKVLKAAFYLDAVEGGMSYGEWDLHEGSNGLSGSANRPAAVEEAVNLLEADLSLKDRIETANMVEETLPILDGSLGEYIRERFGLWSGNLRLLEDCRRISGKRDLDEYEASAMIVKRLWQHLRETHRLRLVK